MKKTQEQIDIELHNSNISNNYKKLIDGKPVDQGVIFKQTDYSDELHNAMIHENYIKLMDGKPVDQGIIFQTTGYSEEVHQANIHNNMIRILNSKYEMKNKKSEDTLTQD